MSDGVKFVLVFFISLFLIVCGVIWYKQEAKGKQFKSQLAFLRNCDSYKSVDEIKANNFSYDGKKQFAIKDSSKIKEIMRAICSAAGPHLVASREGALQNCDLHILLANGETMKLELSKDNRSFVSIRYSPWNVNILHRESEVLSFLFSDAP